MHWFFYLIYFAIGCGVGCFSGLLGVGGGLLVVPILHWVFKSLPSAAAYNMHLAISTSLAIMIFTSISATYFHARKKAVVWKTFMLMAIGMILGAITGPLVSDEFSSRALEIIFGCIELVIAVTLFFYKQANQKAHSLRNQTLHAFFIIGTGFIAAFVGSMLGIGGGIIIVPALMFLGYKAQNAVATSAAALILTAVVGTSSQLVFSYHMDIPNSIGFIYIPATIGLAAGSLIFAPIGVKLAHRISEDYLKKIFIFVLVTFGIIMLT